MLKVLRTEEKASGNGNGKNCGNGTKINNYDKDFKYTFYSSTGKLFSTKIYRT